MKLGYLLIEIMVYLSCSVMLLMFVLIIMSNFYKSGVNHVKVVNSLIEDYSGFNIFIQNLRRVDIRSINLVSKSELIYFDKEDRYRWRLSKNKLICSKNKSHSLVMNRISELNFSINQKSQNLVIRAITSGGKKFNIYVCPRNGLII